MASTLKYFLAKNWKVIIIFGTTDETKISSTFSIEILLYFVILLKYEKYSSSVILSFVAILNVEINFPSPS